MKTRNGFVSNSSSSSFIIAFKKDSVACPHCGRKDPDFLDMVEQSNDYIDDNYVCSSTTEATVENIELVATQYGKEEYANLQKAIGEYRNKKDWIVAEITLSNHDTTMRDLLNELKHSGSIKVLYQSEE